MNAHTEIRAKLAEQAKAGYLADAAKASALIATATLWRDACLKAAETGKAHDFTAFLREYETKLAIAELGFDDINEELVNLADGIDEAIHCDITQYARPAMSYVPAGGVL